MLFRSATAHGAIASAWVDDAIGQIELQHHRPAMARQPVLGLNLDSAYRLDHFHSRFHQVARLAAWVRHEDELNRSRRIMAATAIRMRSECLGLAQIEAVRIHLVCRLTFKVAGLRVLSRKSARRQGHAYAMP